MNRNELRPAAAIDISGVTKVFLAGESEVAALSAATMFVRESEFVSIVGPSGCGKTTLLMIVAGLVAPTGGEVRIDGRKVSSPLTDVGIVFQNPALLDWRTTLGNVMLQAEARGLDRVTYAKRARTLLDDVGLGQFIGRRPYELSGGMQQRVALCRALLHNPPLLLMDEPFGALDALTRTQLGLDLQRMWLHQPMTVMFVTHSIAEAVFLSDRVVVMTERPGTVETVVSVNLPRPRRIVTQQTREFRDRVREVEEIFHAHGILRE